MAACNNWEGQLSHLLFAQQQTTPSSDVDSITEILMINMVDHQIVLRTAVCLWTEWNCKVWLFKKVFWNFSMMDELQTIRKTDIIFLSFWPTFFVLGRNDNYNL